MSIKVDTKRSLSEINIKTKSERKSLAGSTSELNDKKESKKFSLTPNKKTIIKTTNNKTNNDKKTVDNKKSLLKFSYNYNPFIKKNTVKKGEILIHEDTAFSSQKSSNQNTITNPISHRLNHKNNFSHADVGISDLANYSIDRLKKMSEVLMKKNIESKNNLSSLTNRENKTTHSAYDENLTSSTNSKVSLLLNSQRNKQSHTPQPQKNVYNTKEKDTNRRNRESNNNILLNNQDTKTRNEEKLISMTQREKSPCTLILPQESNKRSYSPLIQSSNSKSNVPGNKKDLMSSTNGKVKTVNNQIKKVTNDLKNLLNIKKNDIEKKKFADLVEITNNTNLRGSIPKRRTDNQLTNEGQYKSKETQRPQTNLTSKKLDFKELNTSPLLKTVEFINMQKKSVDSEETLLLQIKQNPMLQNILQSQKKEILKQEAPKVGNSSSTFLNNNNVVIPNSKTHIVKKTIKSIQEMTKTGFDGVATKKNNQDSYFIYSNFMGNSDSYYIGVCDGHGVEGHDVSGYLKNHLPYTLDNEIKKHLKNRALNTIIKDTFIDMNNKVVNNRNIDTQFSGSTCVTVIYTPEKIICANVGDSRAVIGRCEHGSWKSHDLSRDHKPSEQDEKERILKKNGRIEPFRDENGEFIGPERVWLMDEEIPGLAMSRSFGDEVAASVGTNAEPEIKEYMYNKNDAFFIIASDGIWEFIQSEECVNIIKDFYLRNDNMGACDFLLKEASKRWMKEEEVIDDITLIIIFFN